MLSKSHTKRCTNTVFSHRKCQAIYEHYKLKITGSLFYYQNKGNTNFSIAVKGPTKSMQPDMKKGPWHVYKDNTNVLKTLVAFFI